MITGLYSASTNLDAIIHQQDVIARNIANAQVSGHKGETLVFRSFPDLLFSKQAAFIPDKTEANRTTGRLGTGVGVDWDYLNFEPGPMVHTGVPTDLSIDGDGFFAVQTPRGERYTRNSEFQIKLDRQGKEGTLTTKEGYPLLGKSGPIKVPADAKLNVDLTGNVVAGDRTVDRIRLVTVPDKNVLLPESGSLFRLEDRWADQLKPAEGAVVHQGYLEKSNVNTIVEMARMIQSFRNYEAASRVLSVLDQNLNLAVNDVGRIA